MRFRAHETFFLRKGWINKGLKNVIKDEGIFLGSLGNPMDTLGIGANMVKSLRYWLQAVGVTQEPNHGRRVQSLTPFGEILYENDPYTEELGTLWLLHYKLTTNKEYATAWYFFFNEFKVSEFNKEDFSLHLKNYIRINGGSDVSDRSLEDDFSCILNTYLPRSKNDSKKIQPESNIECPLGELGLIDIASKKDKTFRKSLPKVDTIHPLILLAVILDQADNEREIKISSLKAEACQVGKIFNLDIITLTQLLMRIEKLGYIKVIRTAGLDVIHILTEMTFIDCVIAYYQTINN